MSLNNFKLLFFGSDTFSIKILKHLLSKRICRIRVVTGNSSLLHKFACEQQIDRLTWPLENVDYSNIGIVASFGHLIDEKTVKSLRYGLFNVHPSLLPQFRGSTPVQAAILHGLKETGCTIMQIPPIPKFDVGNIVLQEKLLVRDGEYAIELRDRLAQLGAVMTEQLLHDYKNSTERARPQPEEGKSLARKIKPEQGLLHFKQETSTTIDLKVRAYTGFIELFTYCLKGRKVRLEDMVRPQITEHYDLDTLTLRLLNIKNTTKKDTLVTPGTMYFHKIRHILCIKCADSKWLAFSHVTPESKPRMSALEFYNGYLSTLSLKDLITDV